MGAFEVQGIKTTVAIDLAPMRANIESIKADSSAMKASLEKNLANIKVGFSAQAGGLEQIKAQAMAMKASVAKELGSIPLVGNEAGGPIKLEPLKVNRSAIEQQVRDEMAARIHAMRGEAAKANIADEVNRRLFGGTAKRGTSVAGVASGAGAEGKAAGQAYAGSFFDELNGMAGKRSILGKSMKLLMGGGVIGALGMASGEFNALTQVAEKFAMSLNKGPEAARAATAELLLSIPVVGRLAEGFDRIGGLISGDTAYVARLTQEAENLNAVTDSWAHGLKIAQEYQAKITADITEEARIRELIGKQGAEKEAIQNAQDFARKKAAAEKEAEDAAKAVTGDPEEQKRLAGLRQQMMNMAAPERGLTQIDARKGSRADLSYQQDMADFRQKYDTLKMEIQAIEKGQANRLAEIDAAKNKKILEGQKTLDAQDIEAAKEKADKLAEANQSIIDAAAEAGQAGMDEINKQRDAAQASLDAMKRQVEQFNLTPAEKQVADFAAMGGADEAQIEEFRKQVEQLNKLQEASGIKEQIRQWSESLKTPLELYEEMGKKLEDLRDEGLLSQEEWGKGMEKAKAELDKVKEAKAEEPKLVSFIRAGSQEAMKFQFEAALRASGRGEDIPRRQLTEAEKQTRTLESMDRKLEFKVVGLPS